MRVVCTSAPRACGPSLITVTEKWTVIDRVPLMSGLHYSQTPKSTNSVNAPQHQRAVRARTDLRV